MKSRSLVLLKLEAFMLSSDSFGQSHDLIIIKSEGPCRMQISKVGILGGI